VDTESPTQSCKEWFEDQLKRPSVAQQYCTIEKKKGGTFDYIAKYIGKNATITEWRTNDLDALALPEIRSAV
jgi:hypothetical protein